MKSPSVGASGLWGAADNVRSHRGRLDIDLAGVDDLVLVGGRAFDGFPLGLLDLAQLELDLLAEDRADLDRLGLRFVADAARLPLVEAGLDAVLGRLEFALLVHRRGARRLIDRGGRIDHVDHGPLRALVGHGLLTAVDELHRAVNRRGTAGHQHQDDWEKQRSCGHIFLQLIVSEFHGTRYEWAGLQPVLVLAIRCSLRFQIVDPGSARPAQGMPSAAYPFGGANVHMNIRDYPPNPWSGARRRGRTSECFRKISPPRLAELQACGAAIIAEIRESLREVEGAARICSAGARRSRRRPSVAAPILSAIQSLVRRGPERDRRRAMIPKSRHPQ